MTPLEDPFPNPGSWRDPRSDKPLSAEACRTLVSESPPWRLGPSNAELVRTVHFASRLSAVFYLGIVLDFARRLAVEPLVEVRGVDVTVRIGRPSDRALTQRDFQFARRVSLVEDAFDTRAEGARKRKPKEAQEEQE